MNSLTEKPPNNLLMKVIVHTPKQLDNKHKFFAPHYHLLELLS